MTEKPRNTTRREFLKTSGKIAGTVIFSGLSAGCMRADPKPEKIDTGNSVPPEGRGAYKVFSVGQIGTMPVKNRLVRSATMIAAAAGGRPTEEYIEIYRELARGGVAVIITGFMVPTRSDARYSRQIFVYDDDHIPGLKRLADAVHEVDNDCRLVAQIGHSGETVSPSGIKWPFPWKRKGRALATEEVDAIVADFADAIRPENFSVLANEIVKTGVAALDVSGNDCLQEDIEDTEDQAYFFPGAKALEVKTPIILTGGNRSVEYMEKLLQTDEIDFIGMARPLIREPDLPNRWLTGIGDENAACISCNECFAAIMQGKTAYCTQII